MDERPILLITGASGRVGTAYRQHLAAASGYRLRLNDIKPPADQQQDDWRIGDLSDPAFARDLLQGVDSVLHLGADSRPEADFYASLLDNNIKATYNIFAAATAAGARRVVYASSVQTMLGYGPGVQLYVDQQVQPLNMYGVSKCFGEATAAAFHAMHGLSAISVRIGWVTNAAELRAGVLVALSEISRAVTEPDLCHLFDCCLRAKEVGYAIVQGVSNNRFPYLNLAATRALIGYQPQDDAFALAGVITQGWEDR